MLQQQMERQQKEKELERMNLQKIMKHKQQQQQQAASVIANNAEIATNEQNTFFSQASDVFHFPQVSTLSTAGQTLPTYSIDKNFLKDLEKNLGANEAMANMLGPHPPPTPSAKVANIPLLQPPPPSHKNPRASPSQQTSPQAPAGRQRTSPRQDLGSGSAQQA